MNPSLPNSFKYAAFISYSHADEAWARWLHARLERYRVPTRLVGTAGAHGAVPRRLGRCFRDQAELSAASHLGETLQQALRDSQYLVIVCSPRSARSHWVNEEVRYFRSLGRGDRIYALIVEGAPDTSDPAQQCFPPALLLTDDGQLIAEPLAADARAGKDGKHDGFLKLVAGMLGVGFDDLQRREQRRRNRLLAIFAIASLTIATLTTALAISAHYARNAAQVQQRRAEQVKEFMLSVFQEQDPFNRQKQSQRTPLQLMAEASERLDAKFSRDAELHAEILVDLADVRIGLGDSAGAREMLQRALLKQKDLYGAESVEVAVAVTLLAKAAYMQNGPSSPDIEPNTREALRLFERHELSASKEATTAKLLLGRALGTQADDAAEALQLMAEAKRDFELLEGKDSPAALGVPVAQMAVLMRAGRLAEAETVVREGIARMERVVGKDDIRLALPLSELANLLIDHLGRPGEAIPIVERAIAIRRQEFGEQGSGVARNLGQLGLAFSRVGRLEEARRAFDQGERAVPDGDDNGLHDFLQQRLDFTMNSGSWIQAEADAQHVFLLRRKIYGESSPYTWGIASNRGSLLAALGRCKDSEAILLEARERMRLAVGPDDVFNADTEGSLGAGRTLCGRLRDALDPLRRSMALYEKVYGRTGRNWAHVALGLSTTLRKLDQPESLAEAATMIDEIVAFFEAHPEDPGELGDALLTRGVLRLRDGDDAGGRADLDRAVQLFNQSTTKRDEEMAEIRKALKGTGS